MMCTKLHKYMICLLLLLPLDQSAAEPENPLQVATSAIFSLDTYRKADTLQGQYELSLFLDTVYLDQKGVGIGYIHQNQGVTNNDDIVNDIMHFNIWLSIYPEVVAGRISFAINYYRGSETTRGTAGNSGGASGGPGSSKPMPAVATDFTDSLEIINPVISFINYTKDYYLDIGYARSEYKTSDTSVSGLKVSQWTPAIGFALNNQYDWLQLRQYNIDLSSDTRTPGINNTSAISLSWTHWLKKEKDETLDNLTVTILNGKRLYAVDHDIRKVYNLTDMQTRSYIIGANWKKGVNSDFYLYTGYEQYRDVSNSDDYNSLFIYTGITTRW